MRKQNKMALDLAVVCAMEVAFIMVLVLPRVLLVDIKIGKTSFYNLMLWVGGPMYIDMLNTLYFITRRTCN